MFTQINDSTMYIALVGVYKLLSFTPTQQKRTYAIVTSFLKYPLYSPH